MIRPAHTNDAQAISVIYNHYVKETIVTFEEEPVSSPVMEERVALALATPLPWLILEQGDSIVGYARASKWKERSAYRFSVETTIYLAPHCVGEGLGTTLYRKLLDELRQLGVHIAIGGVALPNAASVALHEKCGFRKVAHFSDVGFKFGRWIDVAYWQRAL